MISVPRYKYIYISLGKVCVELECFVYTRKVLINTMESFNRTIRINQQGRRQIFFPKFFYHDYIMAYMPHHVIWYSLEEIHKR